VRTAPHFRESAGSRRSAGRLLDYGLPGPEHRGLPSLAGLSSTAFETNVPGTAHLDMLTWSLPSADERKEFLNVEFITTPNGGVDPVLAAATVGTMISGTSVWPSLPPASCCSLAWAP